MVRNLLNCSRRAGDAPTARLLEHLLQPEPFAPDVSPPNAAAETTGGGAAGGQPQPPRPAPVPPTLPYPESAEPAVAANGVQQVFLSLAQVEALLPILAANAHGQNVGFELVQTAPGEPGGEL
jgi:hypothetical protein